MRRARGRRLFCFGYGFCAQALGAQLAQAGWAVAGTSRDGRGRDGIETFSRDAPLRDSGAALAGTTHLLLSIPPDEAGDPALDLHGADIAAVPELAWIGYLSTTGVYGDTGGAWVDETAPVAPASARARRRAAAERAWLAFGAAQGIAVHVFRLAGIYGPARNALAAARAGRTRRIEKPGQVFSRIHVEDVAEVLQASIARPAPGAVYNVCDDEPAAASAVTAHACTLLGIAAPAPIPLEEADLSPMARSFYAENRRVSNTRIKAELGVTLSYPTYREGLAALLEAGEGRA